MTDKLKGVVVTFDEDIREDDAEFIIHAIGMIKGVLDVVPNVRDVDDMMNRTKIKYELRDKLWEILK